MSESAELKKRQDQFKIMVGILPIGKRVDFLNYAMIVTKHQKPKVIQEGLNFKLWGPRIELQYKHENGYLCEYYLDYKYLPLIETVFNK